MNKTLFKTQTEISEVMEKTIDAYYGGELEESAALANLRNIVLNNEDLVYPKGKLGAILKHRLGKKRLRVLELSMLEES